MTLEGPYADDLTPGESLSLAASITIDAGLAAAYQAITGDGLRLSLSAPDSKRFTGEDRPLVNPALVLQVAIGQSTVATRLVIANLFYRNVALLQQVHVGETLTTKVTPVALALTRPSSRGRRAKVLLRIETVNQDGTPICNFERVALLPCRDASGMVEHGSVGTAEPDRSLASFLPHVPRSWRLEAFPAAGATDTPEWDDPLSDTVSSALELVRLTQNVAAAHRDAARGQRGRRLVYGGHAIGLAQASLSRACPGLVTILGWRACDHAGPVFEGDVLDFVVKVVDRLEIDETSELVGFRIVVRARRDGDESGETNPIVLDWTPVALVRRDPLRKVIS